MSTDAALPSVTERRCNVSQVCITTFRLTKRSGIFLTSNKRVHKIAARPGNNGISYRGGPVMTNAAGSVTGIK